MSDCTLFLLPPLPPFYFQPVWPDDARGEPGADPYVCKCIPRASWADSGCLWGSSAPPNIQRLGTANEIRSMPSFLPPPPPSLLGSPLVARSRASSRPRPTAACSCPPPSATRCWVCLADTPAPRSAASRSPPPNSRAPRRAPPTPRWCARPVRGCLRDRNLRRPFLPAGVPTSP